MNEVAIVQHNCPTTHKRLQAARVLHATTQQPETKKLPPSDSNCLLDALVPLVNS